ncbi:MAG: YcaO-like family protein [Bacillota bacterium]
MATGSPVKDAISRGLRLVDERIGIIQGLIDLPIETNDPRFFHIAAPLADTSRYFGMQCYRHNGGAALTRERAAISAIGEAVERYCGGFYDEKSFVQARPKDLSGKAVMPWDFALFSDAQYAEKGFAMSRPSPDTVFNWVTGKSLVSGKDLLVPACFVYVPYVFRSKQEFITLPISTGLACGSAYEDALLRGLYEVVERDSFAITWLNRLPVPRVKITRSRTPGLAAALQRFREVDLDVRVSLATTDLGIPVVITLSLDDTGAGPSSVIAARADFDIEHSIMRSIEETAQTRLWARKLLRDRPDFAPKEDYSDIMEGADHVRLYCDRSMRKELDFLLNSEQEVELAAIGGPPPETVPARLQRCVDILSSRGYDVIAVDVTTPDIREVGFHVVRVLVPGLQPMDMDHNYRYLGGKRLYEAPLAMGCFNRRRSPEEMNPVPHPFP